MNFEETPIPGLYVINFRIFSDERGRLLKPFSHAFLGNSALNLAFKEVWFTESHKNVIRAMHMQVGSLACQKLVSVVNGAVHDVILDTREDSPTFGKIFETELNAHNGKALYIPVGCAHGYRVLQDNTLTLYMATEVHSPKDDIGYRWDSFGYSWGDFNPIISERDRQLPPFPGIRK